MKDLTKGNIYKTFLLFAIPMVLSGFLSQAYSIIDTIMAGKLLDADSLAMIGCTSAFITFFCSVFWGYGIGFSIYIARLFGAKEYEKLKEAIYLNYGIMIVIVLALSVFFVLFKGQVLELLNVDPVIRDGAGRYFAIYMLGSIFVLLSYNGVYLMNAMGSGSFPLYMSMISTVIHIVGNFISVKYLNLGVLGIAISTVLSAFVVDLCYFAELRKCFKQLGVGDYKVSFSVKSLAPSTKYAIPVMMQQMIMYVSSFVISPMINGIGKSASAAYVICLKVYDINATIYQNSAKTLSNYEAQSIGAKKYENIKKGLRVGFLQGLLFSLPALVLSIVFADSFCLAFLPSGYSGEALNLSLTFVQFFLPFILFNLVNNLFHSFYRGVAAMKLLVVAATIGSVARMIATFLTVGKYGMNGAYFGWAFSWFAEFVFVLFVYYTNRWKREEFGNI